jgi:hypothetical protein
MFLEEPFVQAEVWMDNLIQMAENAPIVKVLVKFYRDFSEKKRK